MQKVEVLIEKRTFDANLDDSTWLHLKDNVTEYNEDTYYCATVEIPENKVTLTESELTHALASVFSDKDDVENIKNVKFILGF